MLSSFHNFTYLVFRSAGSKEYISPGDENRRFPNRTDIRLVVWTIEFEKYWAFFLGIQHPSPYSQAMFAFKWVEIMKLNLN